MVASNCDRWLESLVVPHGGPPILKFFQDINAFKGTKQLSRNKILVFIFIYCANSELNFASHLNKIDSRLFNRMGRH